MTRLQKNALLRPVFPLALVLFAMLIPRLNQTEQVWSFLGIVLIMLPFIWYSSRKQKSEIKEGGPELDELEAQIAIRSYKPAYSALSIYLITALMVFETVMERLNAAYADTLDTLLVFGGLLTAEVSRTIAIWFYSGKPETASRKVKYPG